MSLLQRLSWVGGFVGGVATAAAVAVSYMSWFYDPMPETAQEIVAQLERIASALEAGDLPNVSDSEARGIIDGAARVAAVAARPLDQTDAVVLRVQEGVFDLPVMEAWELQSSDGSIFVVSVARNRSANAGLVGLIFDGVAKSLYPGESVSVTTGGAACKLLLVDALTEAGASRFRWRCG